MVVREIPVSCLPADIPSKLVVDVSDLEIGDSIKIQEVELPENVSHSTEKLCHNFNCWTCSRRARRKMKKLKKKEKRGMKKKKKLTEKEKDAEGDSEEEGQNSKCK